jgi:hypothetical protein
VTAGIRENALEFRSYLEALPPGANLDVLGARFNELLSRRGMDSASGCEVAAQALAPGNLPILEDCTFEFNHDVAEKRLETLISAVEGLLRVLDPVIEPARVS